MICRPDGTVECIVGYHFGRDGTCKPSCTTIGGVEQVGEVKEDCYCGMEINVCTAGKYCIGAKDTT